MTASKLRFSYEEEFISELENRPPDDGSLRLTKAFRPVPNFPVMQHVMVLATFLRGGCLVYLDRYCGQIMSGSQEEKALQTARQVMADIQEAATAAGLTVAPGVLELLEGTGG